jgi:hypothetical protein
MIVIPLFYKKKFIILKANEVSLICNYKVILFRLDIFGL